MDWKKICFFFCCIFFLQTNLPIVKAQNSYEDFYKEISNLVENNWNDSYTGTLQFTIGEKTMLVNGNEKPIDTQRDTVPIIIDGRTFLPIRVIVEEGGGTIQYSQNTAAIFDSGNKITLTIGSKTMYVNGNAVALDAAPVLLNDRILVPLRAVTESLGYQVTWSDENKQTIILSKEFQTKRLIVKAKDSKFYPNEYGAIKIIEGPDFIYILQFDSSAKAQKGYQLLFDSKQILFVEPDKYIPPIAPPKAIQYSSQKIPNWGAQRIKAPEYAKKLLESGKNKTVTIAVIDTGVDSTHPFLQGRIRSDGYNFVNRNFNTQDNHYHGTHVAGIITECTPNLDVEILPIKSLDQYGSGTDLLVGAGIQYAIDSGADVINLSLRQPSQGTGHYIDSMIQKAVENNIVVVAASGNDSMNTKYFCPSHNTNAIIVGAVNSQDNIASFSNYGNSVDVTAPGVDILSSVPNNQYAYLSGTSMASPHVAAVAAMYKMEHPEWTPAQIETEICAHADDRGAVGRDAFYGNGIVNLFADDTAFQIPEPTQQQEAAQNRIQTGESYISSFQSSIRDGKINLYLKTKGIANKIELYIDGSTTPNNMLRNGSSTDWIYTINNASLGKKPIKVLIYSNDGSVAEASFVLNIYNSYY